MSSAILLGKQLDGHSTSCVYDLAEAVVHEWLLPRNSNVADIGGGRGNFGRILARFVDGPVDIFDYSDASIDERLQYRKMDLNADFPIADSSYDACVCLEVIEHLENPRHFIREINRILRPGGRLFLTTPNQLSLSSKLCFLFRDQFQHFQDSCYPAHITALVPQDLDRVTEECGFEISQFRFTNRDRIPFTTLEFQRFLPFLGGKWFSSNVGIVARSTKGLS